MLNKILFVYHNQNSCVIYNIILVGLAIQTNAYTQNCILQNWSLVGYPEGFIYNIVFHNLILALTFGQVLKAFISPNEFT